MPRKVLGKRKIYSLVSALLFLLITFAVGRGWVSDGIFDDQEISQREVWGEDVVYDESVVSEEFLDDFQDTSVGSQDYPVLSSNDNHELPDEKVSFAKVVRVIDGDTVVVEGQKRIRYIGIDTPETVHPSREVECFGEEASEKNKELVEGKVIKLVKDVSETDRFGRLLRYVWVEDPLESSRQIFVNEYLVREGFATSVTYPPDVSYQQTFLEAEREARETGRGLWGACFP